MTDEDFEHILRVWEPPSPEEHALICRNGDDVDTWIGACANILVSALNASSAEARHS